MDKYFEIICHKPSIHGLDDEYLLMEAALLTYPANRNVLFALELKDPARKLTFGQAPAGQTYAASDMWIYGHSNFKQRSSDLGNLKFSVTLESIRRQAGAINSILSQNRVHEIMCMGAQVQQKLQLALKPPCPCTLFVP